MTALIHGKPVNTPETFFDVLQICCFSGGRQRGVEKLLQENTELLRCIRGADDTLINFPWVEWYANDFEDFFKKIIAAMQDDFPTIGDFHKTKKEDFTASVAELTMDVAERCLNKIIMCCGSAGSTLLQRQNQNRHLRHFIEVNNSVKNRLFFVCGWLDENESFFEELRQSLKHIFQNPQYERRLRTWIGNQV